MAQFMAEIQGNKGSVSRLGSKSSGIRAEINGWEVGVSVNAFYNDDLDRDEIEVTVTGGSNHYNDSKTIFTVSEGGEIKFNDKKLNLMVKALMLTEGENV